MGVMISHIKSWLAHPLTRDLDIDDPITTKLRRQILQEKDFLRRIYKEWYTKLADELPSEDGSALEIGTGAGFFSNFIPDLITSDMFYYPDIKVVLDGKQLPFVRGSLRGIVMMNVLHHISQPRLFFREAARCVRLGGVIAMIEPWVTPWSRFVYKKLHSEPFDPQLTIWEFPTDGPLSGANGALPWIIFERDRNLFEQEFPEWQIQRINPCMPFRYLVSGGISMRSLMPTWSFPVWCGLEDILQPWIKTWAMFALITLVRMNP